jgi:hypothetical protein
MPTDGEAVDSEFPSNIRASLEQDRAPALELSIPSG